MRILIIEDERKIANALKKGLEQESFAVDAHYNGKEGLAFALTEAYDLIILDLMLPGIDGLTICKKIRDENISVPILMLTAKDKTSDKVNGLNSGADDYLVKPFSFEELLARVKALIRRPKDNIGTRLQFDDLSLDTISYEVVRSDQVISLSAKEFALLEYLLRHPNQIVTKDQIINHVWDYDADILPNTVEVYIGYLRNKIEKPFQVPPIIHTIRGFGYKMGSK
jgi:DNA-binding response OmpR family regulator